MSCATQRQRTLVLFAVRASQGWSASLLSLSAYHRHCNKLAIPNTATAKRTRKTSKLSRLHATNFARKCNAPCHFYLYFCVSVPRTFFCSVFSSSFSFFVWECVVVVSFSQRKGLRLASCYWPILFKHRRSINKLRQDPLDLSFWSFLTFLHHGIEEVETHLL